jgi:hypothetical protein
VLHPDNVSKIVDEVASGARPDEAAQSLSGVACSFTEAPERFKQFARERHAHVNGVLGVPQ